MTVIDSVFFQFALNDTSDLENALFLLQLTTKKNIQVFVSKNCSYPGRGQGEHLLAFGDLPDSLLFESAMKPHMLEVMQDLTPFSFDEDEDKVKYQSSYRHLNPDLFLTENSDKLDSARLSRLTTWTHQAQGPFSGKTTPAVSEVAKDRLDAFFSTAVWDAKRSGVKIGVFNVHPEGTPVTFEIKAR